MIVGLGWVIGFTRSLSSPTPCILLLICPV